ncbi:RNA polymerase sigma factor [Fontivita pretiosa]|uniref:RNA polymerase sigma factor n=1 Tax=Fontivita pretiosa TaxID=2989684 RepID=UPI003D180025
MADLARGDMAALGSLVRRHQHRVRALAYRLTGRWDLADDLAQETFLRVYRSARSYTPSAAFSTWLYRIVVNLCLDQARRPRLAEIADPGEVQPASQAGSDAPLLDRERAEAIQRAIDALPPRQRIALLLHRFEQMSHAQIAQATGWSESAVESLLVRAYAQLRQRLKLWMQ